MKALEALLSVFLAIASVHSLVDQQAYFQNTPRITLAPRDQKVIAGGTISFFCQASGNPAPEVYWRKGGKRISNVRRFLTAKIPQGSVLRVEPVHYRRDNKAFECVADNGMGRLAVARARLQVYPEGQTPHGLPRIIDHPSLKAVEKGRNTVMTCSATGSPEPSITWLKDYVPLDMTEPRFIVLPSGSLQIVHSLESDEGKYECVAENSVGVTYSYAANLYVRVRRFPSQSNQSELKSVSVPSPPQDFHLTLTQNDPPVVSVSWKSPLFPHGTIDGYKLTYGVSGSNYLEERRFDGDKLQFTTETLKYGSEYEFNLSAKNAGPVDYGIPASTSVKTPDGIPVGAPKNFTAIGLGGTSVKLYWDPPLNRERNDFKFILRRSRE